MKKPNSGVVIDGFVRNSRISAAGNSSGFAASGERIRAAAQNVHKRTQKSQTLMRAVVRKPQTNLTDNVKSNLQPKKAAVLNPARIARAQATAINSKVKRFGNVVHKSDSETKTPSEVKNYTHARAVTKPVSEAKVAKPLPSMVTSASHQQLERLLDQALYKADAHKRTANKGSGRFNLWRKIKNAPTWASIGVGVLVVALLGAFYAWQNVPQVAMRIASTRANVNAVVPGYVPPGFKFTGPVQYNEGAVTIKFKATDSGSREFSLVQEKSNMSNKSLTDTVVPKDTQKSTAQVGGTTVYIYGDNNDAVWVNRGVQYKLKDSASLNSDQILKIADSL